jgi:formylmethanofuran dehydrogenase subunit A
LQEVQVSGIIVGGVDHHDHKRNSGVNTRRVFQRKGWDLRCLYSPP